MKISFFFLCIIFVSSLPQVFAQEQFSALVTKIIDGDSLVVKSGKEFIEIRLYGIDCPEWDEYYSVEARSHTSSLIYRKTVTVIPQYYDSYGRLVAFLFRDGLDINGSVVSSGSGWVYKKYCRKKICKNWLIEEELAKKKGRGLWKIMLAD